MLLHALIKSLASILGIHWFIALVLNLNQWTPRTKYIWIWTNQSDKTHLQSCVFIGLLIAAVRISGVGWITCVRTWFIFLKIWNKQSHMKGFTYWVFYIDINIKILCNGPWNDMHCMCKARYRCQLPWSKIWINELYRYWF